MDANQALGAQDYLAGIVPNGSAKSVQAANQNLSGALQQEDKAMQPAVQKFQQTAAQPMPAPPEAKKASPAPDAQDFNKDAQGWVTALSALSALVGGRGRQRGTGALKAFAAGVNGLQKGNQQAFEDSYKTWKANTDAMMKENDEEMAKYKAIVENRELSESEAMQEMKMAGAEHQNQVMAATHTADQAFAVYDSIVKARASVEAANAKVEQKAQQQIKQQEQQEDKQQAALKEFDGLKETDVVPGYGLTKGAIMQKVEGLKDGLSYADVGISMRSTKNPVKDMVDSVLAAKYPESNREESKLNYLGTQQEERVGAKNFESMEVATQRLDKSIPLLLQKVQAINPVQFKSWNQFENWVNDNAGDPRVAELQLVVEDTRADFETVQAKGGQVTDKVRGRADLILNSAWNRGQFKGVTDTMQRTSQNQMDAALAAMPTSHLGKPNYTAPAAPAGGAPAGVDAELWKHATPEEKALWQTPSQ